jgi:succinate dehydrogenase/fumarate reductase cytochrome b subunit
VLGSGAVAFPNIDVGIGPNNAFSTLAVAAGLIQKGQTFNPYADDVSFLLGASIFEDVGVTAYAGAAALIGTPAYVTAAACILAVEAYHSGAIRTLLADIGAGAAFDQISALRATLSGAQDEVGILIPGNNYNFVPTDSNSLVFRRTTSQVLNVVYGNTSATPGLFFPNGLNGNIR